MRGINIYSLWLNKLILAIIITAFYCHSAKAHEVDSKVIDWETQLEMAEILPIVQSLYVRSKPVNQNKKDGPEYTHDEITQGVVSDYAALISFAYSRDREFPRAFVGGGKMVQVANLAAYEEHYHKLPDNITIFGSPALYSNSHSQGACNIECQKMLFENRVKSLTIVNNKRVPHNPNLNKDPFFFTPLNDSNSDVVEYATRYFKAPCKPSKQGWPSQSWRNTRRGKTKSFVNPVLDLCIDSEETRVPDHGFYFNTASPIWPEALTPKDNKRVFPELTNIDTSLFYTSHWSMKTPSQPEPQLLFEEACVKVVPPLPKSAIELLDEEVRRISIKNKVQISQKKITIDWRNFCYRTAWAEASTHITNHFFPRSPDNNMRLDFHHVMSTDEIIGNLLSYKFPSAIDTNEQQVRSRRGEYINTLIFLSQSFPDYYKKIFPKILSRIFDASPEGLRDSGSLIRLFHEAKPPIGSLSDYTEDVEQLFEERLKELGCDNWQCPKNKKTEGGLFELNNMIVGLGRAGLPLVVKMEEAGMKNIDKISTCIGALTPMTQARFYGGYKSYGDIGAATILLKNIPLPETKPATEIPGRFYNDVEEAKAGKHISLLNNLGYSTNREQVYFFDGIHPEIEQYLKEHNLIKSVKSIKGANYDYAKALLMTEHAIEVSDFLEDRLEFLQSETTNGNNDDKMQFKVKSEGTVIVQGMPIEKLATIAGQRQKEINTIKTILSDYHDNRTRCEYRKFKSFDPFH